MDIYSQYLLTWRKPSEAGTIFVLWLCALVHVLYHSINDLALDILEWLHPGTPFLFSLILTQSSMLENHTYLFFACFRKPSFSKLLYVLRWLACFVGESNPCAWVFPLSHATYVVSSNNFDTVLIYSGGWYTSKSTQLSQSSVSKM